MHIGGIPFPLNGDGVSSNPDISPNDFKILMTNADVIIDQTELPDGNTSKFSRWRVLAGLAGNDFNPRVWYLKKIYSLDNTVSKNGISGKEDHRHQMG